MSNGKPLDQIEIARVTLEQIAEYLKDLAFYMDQNARRMNEQVPQINGPTQVQQEMSGNISEVRSLYDHIQKKLGETV